MVKYTTPAATTAAEAINNVANEIAHINGVVDMLVNLLLAEKAKADARHAEYEAEEAKRRVDEAKHDAERQKREAERQKREDEREAKREAEEAIDNLDFQVGMRFELLKETKKDGEIKVGDTFEITGVDFTRYETSLRMKCKDFEEQEVTEGTLKRMLHKGFLKQL